MPDSCDRDVRFEKVAEVQEAIAAGTYAVPAPAVARSMVDAMLSVGRNRQDRLRPARVGRRGEKSTSSP
ncbi:MAG TPA: flagellar biosynthesis anti-sigma factor FlgM [Terracidiphilus sp.]|nr:flagellar biosynthesis anti-sigma factor FlgM [Terracidiphilus sp.]